MVGWRRSCRFVEFRRHGSGTCVCVEGGGGREVKSRENCIGKLGCGGGYVIC